jgi:hypothetical protein
MSNDGDQGENVSALQVNVSFFIREDVCFFLIINFIYKKITIFKFGEFCRGWQQQMSYGLEDSK